MKKKNRLLLGMMALLLSLLMLGQTVAGSIPAASARSLDIEKLEEENTVWQEMLDSYNEKWTGQSENCAGSMPVGGGNLALNVWAEGDEVLFYLGSTDSIDENLVLEKLGRIRIKMSPNPFTDGLYTQELKLRQGYIEITGSNNANSAKIDIWVDIFNGTVNVDIENDQPTTVTAVYENWRTEDNKIELPSYEEQYITQKYMFKDNFKTVDDGKGLMFYHRNRSDVALYEDLVEQQGLSQYKDQLFNPLENYTFGGLMKGTNMVLLDETYTGRYASTDFTAWQMQTAEPHDGRRNHRHNYRYGGRHNIRYNV